jgi:hypothetical protein
MDAANATPRFRLALVAMVSAALLVPLAVYGAPAIAKSASSASHQYSSAASTVVRRSVRLVVVPVSVRLGVPPVPRDDLPPTHSKKHPWRLITVSSRALKAHLRHGDRSRPARRPAAKKKHGHGHDDGQHGDSSTKHDRD